MKTAITGGFFNSLMLFIVSISLINGSIFIYPTLVSLYGYILGIALAAAVTGVILLNNRSTAEFKLPGAFLFFLSFVLYSFSNASLKHQLLNLNHTYWLVSLLLFLVIILVASRTGYSYSFLFNGITIVGFIEAMICVFQYVGWLSSRNSFFDVTGTWANPNVTAMFLALCIPILLAKLVFKEKASKYYLAALMLIIIALLMLQCRSALLGVMVSAMVIANYRYNLTASLLNKRNRTLAIILLITGSSLVSLLAVKLYTIKQNQQITDYLFGKDRLR